MSKRKASKPIPPDPEGMNDARAEWAEVAIVAFLYKTNADIDNAVADLLCDLRHWCDRNGRDFAYELARAREHYTEETKPQGDAR